MKAIRVSALLALALAACGDPLASGDYAGEPLIELRGQIIGDAGTSKILRPHLGVVWIDPMSWEFNAVTSLSPITEARFPGDFTTSLFEPPPADAFIELGGARYAVGLAIVVDDVNGDGKFAVEQQLDSAGRIGIEPPDLMFGVNLWEPLLYGAGQIEPACSSWVFGGGRLPSGFRLGRYQGCSHLFDVLPADTAMSIRLFPPSSRWPSSWEEEEGSEPISCEYCVDPSAPLCAFGELQYECAARECQDEDAAFFTCTSEHCGWDMEDYDACVDEHCGEVFRAWTSCQTGTCGMGAICEGLGD
ncbi:hypothetical protein [Vulgatibacter sp.]|uniref:hypothetical protein n=1 Tax=Vulgatibacter sp. TaxID=1971226 RepID=UPI00356A4A8C